MHYSAVSVRLVQSCTCPLVLLLHSTHNTSARFAPTISLFPSGSAGTSYSLPNCLSSLPFFQVLVLAPAAQLDFHVNSPVFQVQQFTGEFCIYFAAVTPKYGCVCACDCTTVLQSIRFQVPNVEIETLCQRACSCPQLRGGPEQRDFTASCLHGAISPTCAFPPISHLQSRKWEPGSTDENERNVFETPQKGPVFVPTIRHHQNEPTDPPIWCWHQHQTQMLVCHLCFREGGQFAWPKTLPPPLFARATPGLPTRMFAS